MKFLKDFGASVSRSNKLLLYYMEILAGLEKRLQEGEKALKNTSQLYQRKISKLADKQKVLDERLQKISDETPNVIKIDVTGVEDEDERFILVIAAVREYYSHIESSEDIFEPLLDALNEQQEKDLSHLEENQKVSSDDELAQSPGDVVRASEDDGKGLFSGPDKFQNYAGIAKQTNGEISGSDSEE